MKFTIDELMKAVNCTKFPKRWREIYDEAMKDFETNGCELINPGYYDMLGDTYGILNRYRGVYKKAAKKISEDEALSAFLALLCYALRDRENSEKELGDFTAPMSPDGGHRIEYDMLTGLAVCSQIPYCHDNLKRKGLPQNIIDNILNAPESYVDEYMRRNDGAYGFSLLFWCQLLINGKMFLLERLNFHICDKFQESAIVFKNKSGEYMSLACNITVHISGRALGAAGCEDEHGSWRAEIKETEENWIGYPYNQEGLVEKTRIALDKGKWEIAIKPGDPVIGIHIPAGNGLTEKAVDDSVIQAKKFIETYFPECKYKAFTCFSWMLDPQLEEFMGGNSNIVKFAKRFNRITAKSQGEDIFYFVFKKNFDDSVEIEELPENTRLEKALKSHYLQGKVINETYGYFVD